MTATTAQRSPAEASSLRERKKERTKSAMIDAALQLFAAEGYHNVTVQDIADAAEVSATTFFRYFATKEDVLFTDAHALDALLAAAAATAHPELDDIAAMQHITRTVFGEHFNLDHVRARYLVSVSTPELRGRVADSDRRWRESMVRALQQRHGLAAPTRATKLTARVGTAVLSAALEEWTSTDAATASKDRLLTLLDEWFAQLRSSSRRWPTAG
jgi:AcrR family transcriptional regulator